MRNRLLSCLTLLCCCGFSGGAFATILTYTTTLTGAAEVPATVSLASGSSTIIVDTSTKMLSISVTFSGLNAPVTAAHIQCCTPANANVGVAVGLAGFQTTASGNYNQSFDLALSSSYFSGFFSAHGGTAAAAELALMNGLNSGLAYVNLHNSIFPAGEIRGQFAPAQTRVPEPGLLGLMGLAWVMLVITRRAAPL